MESSTTLQTDISPLTPGATYSFQVFATNSAGPGQAKTSNSIEAPNVPDAPGNVTAIAIARAPPCRGRHHLAMAAAPSPAIRSFRFKSRGLTGHRERLNVQRDFESAYLRILRFLGYCDECSWK